MSTLVFALYFIVLILIINFINICTVKIRERKHLKLYNDKYNLHR